MIKEKTVFILGAGASHPYGYPTGKGLRNDICKNFVDQYKAFLGKIPKSTGRITLYKYRINKAVNFIDNFYNSSTKSTDLFISRNPNFSEMGKYAILFSIFKSEKNSKFREELDGDSEDWYNYLFNRMTDEFTCKNKYHISENNVSFISFNYDRSFEHFLFQSTKHSFTNIEEKNIIDEINKIKFIHVYGQIAKLNWQDIDGVEYKSDKCIYNAEKLIDNIKVIYEERENPDLEIARNIISDSKRIYFLGFGYAIENLEILNIPQLIKKDQHIYGTALGCSEKEITDITHALGILEGNKIVIKNMDCLALLKTFL